MSESVDARKKAQKSAWDKRNYAANCDEIQKINKLYYKKNRKRILQRRKELLENNPALKEKNRFWNIKTAYGLTREQYNALLLQQDNKCAICGGPPQVGKRRPSVDHDHASPDKIKVRGILCAKCNVGLGHFNDSPQILLLAIKYLTDYLRREEQIA